MKPLELSSPWVIYTKKIQALFGRDEEINFQYINETPELRIYVDNQRKADAISRLLPVEKVFGNETLKITVIPSDTIGDRLSDIREAFRDNPILDHISTSETPGGGKVTYVSFKKEVVQFFNDDLSDENGYCSTLYQELAKDLFGEKGEIYFCTSVET